MKIRTRLTLKAPSKSSPAFLSWMVAAFAASLVISPVQAQDAADEASVPAVEEDISTVEIRNMLRRSIEKIQRIIEARAEVMEMQQERESLRERIALIKVQEEYEKAVNPEVPVAPVVEEPELTPGVVRVIKVALGRSPRATVELAGGETKRIKVGSTIGDWKVERISRDELRFSHMPTGETHSVSR